MVASVEEYWPWVGGICKCLGANGPGFPGVPRGQLPGMAADKCIILSYPQPGRFFRGP